MSPVSIVEIMRVYLLEESIWTSQYENPGMYLNTYDDCFAHLAVMSFVQYLIVLESTVSFIAWKHTFNYKQANCCVIAS